MEPEIKLPQLNPEMAPVQHEAIGERTPNQGVIETGIETSAEHFEQRSDMSATLSDIGLMTTLPTPVVTTPVVIDGGTSVSDSPVVANDDDLIEKEWVDKAKKIVAATQNDPHQREKAVSELQVEYIKKRYGRELGVAE